MRIVVMLKLKVLLFFFAQITSLQFLVSYTHIEKEKQYIPIVSYSFLFFKSMLIVEQWKMALVQALCPHIMIGVVIKYFWPAQAILTYS